MSIERKHKLIRQLAKERNLYDGLDILCEGGHVITVRYFKDLHHKDGNFSNNKPENLLLLCSDCHRREDKRRRGKY